MTHDASDHLEALLAAAAEGALSDDQQRRLEALLADHPENQDLYARYMALHAWLSWERPSSQETEGERLVAGGEQLAHTPARSASEKIISPTRSVSEETTRETSRSSLTPRVSVLRALREAFWHPIALLLIVGFVSAGILAYVFSTKPAAQPVAQQPLPAGAIEPAAKLVGTFAAKWASPFRPEGDGIKPGQRLILHSGSAEIAFNKQARVIFEGPADFVITDAAACRLDGGKLTAHVPEPARGFKVHTPDGTVTDLGTEFGVYVKSEVRSEKAEVEEQQESGQQQGAVPLPPVTEVHVFKGKVEIGEVGSRKSEVGDVMAQNPTSDLRPPTSTILSAGQAVTISDKKIEPLPAADPFKFALDKLNGKPRTVLLSEDFEKYDVGVKREKLGDWIVQGSTRKGQFAAIGDYDKWLANEIAGPGLPDPSLNPPPPSISRILMFAPSAPNPTGDFPKVARAIKAPQLARTCQVLVEFLILPTQPGIEPSFALAAEVGPAPGIEFWRNADPAAPPIPWKTNQVVYRVRVLMSVVGGTLRDARVERSQWSGSAGWVRDAEFATPVPKVDWATPPKYAIFGYPVVTAQTAANRYSIDNIRIEVISEE